MHTPDDLHAIEELAANWRAGWLRGDTQALISLYADDPVLMPQGGPVVRGKDAIRAMYASVFAEVTIESESTLEEAEASGDLGYFWSTYSLTATPRNGGDPIRSIGKSLFILRRQKEGVWRIARLMDNSSR